MNSSRKGEDIMKKVVILLTVAMLLMFSLAINPAFGNWNQLITRDRNGGIDYVSGEGGSWEVPILVYSDSNINVYIPNGMISSRVVYGLGWNQKAGKFAATCYIEYKKESSRKKIASAIKKSGTGLWYPDLFRYLSESAIFDMQNRKMTIKKQIFIDRDGEIIGLSEENITMDLDSHTHDSSVNMQIAKNILELLNKASKDPKLANTRDGLRKQNEIVKNMVKNQQGSVQPPDGWQMKQLQGKDAKDINDNSISTKDLPSREYATYSDTMFGYKIDYPQKFVRKTSSSNEANKILLVSPDKKAILVLHAENTEGRTLIDYYNDVIKNSVLGDHILYQVIKDNWFVVKWTMDYNGSVYTNYTKVYVGKGSFNGFMFSYHEQEKDKYDNVVTNMEKSFVPGDIDRAW